MNKKRYAVLLTVSMALRAVSYTVGNVPASYFLFGDTNNVCMTSERNWVEVSRTSSAFQLTEENPSLDFHAAVSLPDKTVVGWGEAPEMNYKKIKWRINQSTTDSYTCTYDSSYTGDEIYLFVLLRYLQYTLKFNANGGSAAYDKKDICYTNSVALPVSERTGYSFDGWTNAHSTAALKGTVANLGEVLGVSNDCSDVYLFAKWTVGRYTVSFDANYDGGTSAIPSKMVTYDSQYGDLPQLTRSGYVFDGWYTATADGTKVYPHSVVRITADQMLYAHWTPQAYRVTFDVNYEGGVISPAYTNIAFSTEYGALPQPTRAGYVFDGWYTMADGGSVVTSGTIMRATSAHTLYAHWTPLEYAVTFNAEGGEVSTSSITVTYGSAYESLPTPTRTGYKFDGWHTAANGGTRIVPSDSVAMTSEQTLHAHWAAKMYKLYFDANGGTVSPASTMVRFGSSYENLPKPMRIGYTFNGWHTAADGGSMVQATDKVEISDAQTLHAHWTANTYKVTFSANYEGAGSSSSTANVTYDSAYDALPTLMRTGYTFDGWFTSAEGGSKVTADTIMNVAGAQTLYAHWTTNRYTVTFDSNGGGGVPMPNMELAYDEVVNLLPCTFEWTGYSFESWTNTDGKVYLDCAAVSNLTAVSNGVVTLYAVSTANVYTVTFDAGSGTVGQSATSVTYDESYGKLPEPRRTGYTFAGWYTEAGAEVTANTPVSVAEEHTLYAHWTTNRYTVTFDSNGGGGVPMPNMELEYDVVTNLALCGFMCTGHTFKGWATNDAADVVVLADGAVFSNLTSEADVVVPLRAVWEANRYTVSFSSNGGDGTMDAAQFKYGSEDNLPSNKYTKTGYTFVGWATNATDNVDDVLFGDEVAVSNLTADVDGSVMLYAVWAVISYTIEFNSAGGSEVTSITQDYGTEVTAPAEPEKTGYTFAGWKPGLPATMPASNSVLTAQWTTNSYTISFDSAGGSEVTSITQDYGTAVTAPADPEKTGYSFAGWTPELPTTMPASNNVLTAQWNANRYTVTFSANGGTGNMAEMKLEYGVVTNLRPCAFERTGYSFKGWATTNDTDDVVYGDCAAVSNLTAAANGVVTLYAVSTASVYKVTLDSAGGTVSPSETNVTYGAAYGKLPTAEPLDLFQGWFTAAEGGDEITGSTIYTNASPSDHTLYAHWTSKYSVAADCTNLVLACADNRWYIDPSKGCDFDGNETDASSVAATNNANMTVPIDGIGTLTFRYRVDDLKHSGNSDLLEFFGNDMNNREMGFADTGDEWRLFATYSESSVTSYIWRCKNEDVKCWVDQVHWYPDKKVSSVKNTVPAELGSTDTNRFEIVEAVLRNWDKILGDKLSVVESVGDKISVDVQLRTSPAAAIAKLKADADDSQANREGDTLPVTVTYNGVVELTFKKE